jgi:hypothetical protein
MPNPQMFVEVVASGGQSVVTVVGHGDNVGDAFGDDEDFVIVLNSAGNSANTAITDVLVGTPVTPALAANSAILSNTTEDGDILFAVRDGDHSKGLLHLDGSAGSVTIVDNLTFDGTELGVGTAAPEATVSIANSGTGTSNIALKLHNASSTSNSMVTGIGFGIVTSPGATPERMKGAFLYAGDGTGYNRGDFVWLNDAAADTNQAVIGDEVMRLAANGMMTYGGAQARDVGIIFDNAGTDYHIGIDQNVDDLVIGKGTTLGTTTGMAMDDDLHFGVGVAPSEQDIFIVNATNSETDARRIFRVAGTANVEANSNGAIALIGGTLAEAETDTTHPNMSTLVVTPPTITSGDAATTAASTVWITGTPSGATSNYALWVDAGTSRFDGNIESPTLMRLVTDYMTVKLQGGVETLTYTGASAANSGGLLELVIDDGAATASGHRLGGIAFMGAEDSSATTAIGASIMSFTSETWGSTDNDAYMAFSTSNANSVDERMRINTSGEVFIGLADAGGTRNNGNMTVGLTINQEDADDEILALKSSDVTNPFTSVGDADNYFTIMKKQGSSGGAYLQGFKSDAGTAAHAFYIRGHLGEVADTTTGTGGNGVVQLDGVITNGSSGSSALAADGNLLVVSSAGTAEFIVKGDGELHSNESATVGTFDSYDDAQLIRTLDHTRQSPTMIRERWDDFIKYNEQDLVEAGILGDTRENGGMLNVTGLQRLHNGAIWQGYVKQQEMQEKIDTLESRLLAIEGAK